jgi:hypothetical protein
MFVGAVAFGGACRDPVGEAAGFDFSPAISPPAERRRIEKDLARITFGAQ